jgi:hypothetical protein
MSGVQGDSTNGRKRNAEILMKEYEGYRPLGRYGHRGKGNIKMDLKGIG